MYQDFEYNQEYDIYITKNLKEVPFLDGSEEYLFNVFQNATASAYPIDLQFYIKDWPSRYHLSYQRINLLIAIKELLNPSWSVLECGAGMGGLTSWLSENFAKVDAIEGNLKRARVLRQRVGKNKNVRVFVADLLNDPLPKRKYDMITLVGVLEYVPFYSNDKIEHSVIKFLENLKNHLNEEGIVLIAIENKLGVKYFAGCTEDHTGRLLDSLMNYPNGKSPITFSRNELEFILKKARFNNVAFYHLFPDYKLPTAFIKECDEIRFLNPHNFVRGLFEDYRGNRYFLIPDPLFLETISQAGLLHQFSNSFLVLASQSKTVKLTAEWIIKKIWNHQNSKPIFHHEIALYKNEENNKLIIKRKPLAYEITSAKLDKLSFYLGDDEYVLGKSLIYDAYKAIIRNDEYITLCNILNEVLNSMLDKYYTGEFDQDDIPLVSGKCIDYTLHNLIKTDDGKLFFIDRKWVYNSSLSADFVIFRSLYTLFYDLFAFITEKRFSDFVIKIMKKIFPMYDYNRFLQHISLESEFQTLVSLKPVKVRDVEINIDRKHLFFKNEIILNEFVRTPGKKSQLQARVQALGTEPTQRKSRNEEERIFMTVADNEMDKSLKFNKRVDELEIALESASRIFKKKHEANSRDYQKLLALEAKVADLEKKLADKNATLQKVLSRFYRIIPMRIETRPSVISDKISVIIPVKNGGELLRELLSKIRSQRKVKDVEIIVIDSESTDNSVQIAIEYGAKVIKIPQREFNHGATRNLGAKEANGDYLVFTVQDAMPINDYWLYKMICPFIEYPELAALSSKQFVKPEADLFSFYMNEGILYFDRDVIYSLSGNMEDIWKFLDSRTQRKLTFFDNVSSCVRRGIFEEIQFTPLIFAEDMDYGARLLERRKTLGYLRSTGVYHWHERGAEDVFKRHYISTKVIPYVLKIELEYFFHINNISWEWLVANLLGIYDLISISIADTGSINPDPRIAVKSFINALQRNMDILPDKTGKISKIHENSGLELLLKEIVGDIAFIPEQKYNFNQNFLISYFMKYLENFTAYLCSRHHTLEGREKDFISCIYKIFALTAGEALGAYYLEAEALNRLTSELKRIDLLLGKGVCYF